jgi:ABC-type lipoprotein export system ATPase subunit
VLAIFTRLNRAGHTVILITHELGVAALARRVIRLSDGEIASDEALEVVG